ncbi:MAG: hypothetical protein EYC62_05900 [Alphaproteobacteria bacterium]|nr:MAG: hypothetical protein EYC62_05900 [Alphaproteobacteria bacterium]
MSRVGAELANTLVDEVLSEATVDFWDKVKEKAIRLIDTITFKRGTGAKIEQVLKSKVVGPAKRWALQEIPVPEKIARRARESSQTRMGRIIFNSALFAVNHPVPRFVITAGLLAGITLALGFAPMVIPTTLAAAYAIKITSAYAFMAAKHGIEKWRNRNKPAEKTKPPRKLTVREKSRTAIDSLCEVAFGKGQKNPYLNIMDIVMTVTSGVLLLPTCAHLNQWITQALRAPQRASAESIAQSAGLTQVGEAAESGMVRQMGGETARQVGRQMAVRGLQAEGTAVSHSFLSRLATAASAIPERGFGVVGQGTIKYFGGGLARKYAPEFADEAAMGVAAAAGFAWIIPVKLRGISVKFSSLWKKTSEPIMSSSLAMNGLSRVM